MHQFLDGALRKLPQKLNTFFNIRQSNLYSALVWALYIIVNLVQNLDLRYKKGAFSGKSDRRLPIIKASVPELIGITIMLFKQTFLE